MTEAQARPRVLVLASTYPRWAGDPEPGFVHALSARLAVGHDVTVVCPHSPGSQVEEVLDGVRVVRYRYAPSRWETLVSDGGIMGNLRRDRWKCLLLPGFAIAQVIAVVRLLRQLKPDAVHAHWIIPQGLVAVIALAISRVPAGLLVTSHGADLYSLRARWFMAIKRFVLRRADAITVVSHAMVPAVQSILPTAHVDVEPMGVDLKLYAPDPTVERSAHDVLFVGRLVEKKGLVHLLDAWPQVLARCPAARLDIVGFGPLESPLKAKCEALGIAGSVRFVGSLPQDALPDRYRRAAVFVAPFVVAADGDQEGLGLVLVEAAGCGCPVVAGDVPAVRDVLGDSEGGAIVPANDPKALSQAILDAMQAGAADPAAVARFDWDARAASYAGILSGICRQ